MCLETDPFRRVDVSSLRVHQLCFEYLLPSFGVGIVLEHRKYRPNIDLQCLIGHL